MVVNAPDSPVQAEVIFVIEATAANGAFINDLKTNYIIPTLEYFHGGALEEGGGSGSTYCIVTYKSADCHPADPVATLGPFDTPQRVLEAIDAIQFVGGHAEGKACITEALTMAMECFDELGRPDTQSHVLLVCTSPPYSMYAGGLAPPGAPATAEAAARQLSERGVHVSVAAARRAPALLALYELAHAGDLLQPQPRNYAKDPRHLVLLRGYSLKERPPSPAPPPAPDIVQPDVYGQGRGAVGGARAPAAAFPRARWAAPPRPALYATNSALLTQLAQPSYPPPAHPAQPTTLTGHQRMASMAPAAAGAVAPQAPPMRSYIWSGVIEWMEKGKPPGDQQKTTKLLPCQVSASTKDIEPELKVDTWPNKLLMQLMPKQLISSIGGQYLKDSKSVLFHLQPSEALDSLTKVMVNGFAGCVHFSPMSSPPQCDIKVLILLYTPDKKAYLGFIPNNQATFVERLRKVIQQQKQSQMNKQMPTSNMPQPPIAGSSGMSQGGMPQGGMPQGGMPQGGMPQGGMQQGGMQQGGMQQGGMQQGGMQQGGMQQGGMQQGGMQQGGMQQGGMQQGGMPAAGMSPGLGVPQLSAPAQPMQPQMQPHQQGMMISGGIPGQGGKGPRPNQLDGLEAARQQNLEKIQHLQQTLEAAHQQEAQFKSQMDIMSHLHAAQQTEQRYKQLEEQRKHQLQQQLQQQMRGGGGHLARGLRPILPSNPGLRHLLQQQPQYRTGQGAVRPASQSQPFDDVNNYGDLF